MWFLLGTASLVLLLVAAGVIYTRSENFTRWARDEAVSAVNNMIKGSIRVERLEGSVWSNLTLYNVALLYENGEILRVPQVQVSFSLWRLIWGELQISQIEALQPRADLKQDAEGRWNIAEAVTPRQPEPEQKSDFTTLIKSVRLRDGAIDLRVATADEKLYRLQNLDMEAGVGIVPDGVSLEVRELVTGLVSKGLPELRLKGALGYQQMAGAPATVKISDLWAVSRNSRIKLTGEIAHRDTTKIKAQALVEKLAPTDIAYFVAEWPLKREVAGKLSIDGALDDLSGEVNFAGAGATLAGKFRANTTQDPLRYTAAMTIRGFDLRQWLEMKTLAGVVNGTIEARGNGFALQNTEAKSQLEVRAAGVEGWTLGTIKSEAHLQNSIATLDGRLEGDLGLANWSGKVSLKDKQPSYDFALAVKDLAIEKTVPNATTTAGKLNFQGAVKGSGINLADMNTRAEMRILPSSIGPLNLQQGAIDATLRQKKLQISRASFNTAESVLTLNGELGLDANSSGNLEYRFRAADVAPWLSLVNQKGSGSLDLAGQARGNLTHLQTQGTVRFSGLRYNGATVRSGDANFALRGSKDQLFPDGVVTLRATGLDAGMALRRFDGKATLTRAPAQTIQLDLGVQDSADRKHALNGTVNIISADVLNARLNQLTLSAPDGVWKLARPADLSKRQNDFFVEQLSLRNGVREVSLDGRIGVSGEQDLRLNIERVPLASLTAFMAQPPKVSGILAGSARVGGTAAAPEIASNLKLSEPTIAGQAYAGAVADVQYKDKKALLRAVIQQDGAHSLTANGTVPLVLSWSDTFHVELLSGMDVRLQSGGVSVGFLNAFSGKAVEGIAGIVELDVVARGSFKQPDLRGNFRLRDGRLKVVPLNVDVNALTISGGLDSRNLSIREISAKAKDGEIRGSGSLALKQFEVSSVKLSLDAKRWPAIDTARYQLRVAGNVDVEGALTGPIVKGKIDITEGSLRPDLAFLEQSKAPTKRDETIVVIRRNGKDQSPAAAGQNGASTQNGFFNAVALNLTLRGPGNLWVRHPDLVAELSGDVRISKQRDRDLDLSGQVDVVRGWFAFQGRRFQLVRGTVEFTGGDKINPSLDIVAEYRLPDVRVEAVISGTIDKPTLTLTSDPRMEQADILAVLLFGRRLNNLNQSEQISLQQSAINITSGFVAGRIANSVATALGLDSLGIDIREMDFSGGRIGFGHYIGSKTYLSASQEFSGEHGQEVSVQYEIVKDLKIGTSTKTTGESGIDIIWHKRY
jgi:autotransporter translocation and assembly factor TamB